MYSKICRPIHPKSNHFFKVASKKIGTLLMSRHAECDHNVGGHCAGYLNSSKPTAKGLERTRQENELLKKSTIKIDTAYVSPLARVLITADVLLDGLPTNISPREALVERNFGAYTGLSKNQIKEKLTLEKYYQYLSDEFYFPPDIEPGHKYFQSNALYGAWPKNHKGESYQCVIKRLLPFLEELKTELLNNKNILIMGHSHNLQLLQMLLCGTSFKEGIDQYKMQHATIQKFKFRAKTDNKLIVTEQISLDDEMNSINASKEQSSPASAGASRDRSIQTHQIPSLDPGYRRR